MNPTFISPQPQGAPHFDPRVNFFFFPGPLIDEPTPQPLLDPASVRFAFSDFLFSPPLTKLFPPSGRFAKLFPAARSPPNLLFLFLPPPFPFSVSTDLEKTPSFKVSAFNGKDSFSAPPKLPPFPLLFFFLVGPFASHLLSNRSRYLHSVVPFS